MAVNLQKNYDSLKSAWKDVLDEKTQTNWAIFGYEGHTNDLKVVSKGSQGIEEMIEDLNSGKIMYVFLKVMDPKTSLPKFVLINWQGEGANIVRKGVCANHLRDVANFFSGAQVTINARNEEEVEPQIIIEKVAKSTGSAYSFKAPRGEIIEAQKPVGTNYQRVNPGKEINAQERNQFWMREEEEERKRVEEERKRRELERIRLEEELKRREMSEAAGRDIINEKRNATINEIRQAEVEASLLVNKQKLSQENERLEQQLEPETKVNQSELLRKQRSEEAQQLIGKRTTNARSIFEQNTSAGQLLNSPVKRNNGIRSASKIDTSKFECENVTQSPTKKATARDIPAPIAVNDVAQDFNDSDEHEQFSTIKRSPKSPNEVSTENLKNTSQHPGLKHQETVIERGAESKRKEEKLPPIVTEQQIVDEMVYQDLGEDLGLRARALYDYQAADDTEITFDPGDIITHIDQIDEGWWQGMGPDGTFGLFPANYVELIF